MTNRPREFIAFLFAAILGVVFVLSGAFTVSTINYANNDAAKIALEEFRADVYLGIGTGFFGSVALYLVIDILFGVNKTGSSAENQAKQIKDNRKNIYSALSALAEENKLDLQTIALFRRYNLLGRAEADRLRKNLQQKNPKRP